MTADAPTPPVPAALADALARRAPRFWAWASAAAPAHAEVSPHGEHGTLVVRGLHLASALEPQAEARLLAEEAIPAGTDEAWVFGTGSALVEAALARAARVRVVGLAPDATLAELSSRAPAWALDPRVTLLAPDELHAPRPPWVVASAELRLAPAGRLRDALLLALMAPFQQRHHAELQRTRAQRALDNHARFGSDEDVARLFGTGRPWAAIAAGGPSLPACLAAIAPSRASTTLVATTTALVELERAGMTPDVAVAVDRKPSMVDHLAPLHDLAALAGVPLVYALETSPELLERWPGPRLACRLSLPGYAALAARWPCAELFCSGTVTHTAVDLAIRMGAADVVLLGADFGYPGGRSHATAWWWSPDVSDRRLLVDGVAGAPITTDPNLLGYRHDLEAYIEAHPAVRFWNASTVGARIAGTRSYPP